MFGSYEFTISTFTHFQSIPDYPVHLHEADKAGVGPVTAHSTEHEHFVDKARVVIAADGTLHLHVADKVGVLVDVENTSHLHYVDKAGILVTADSTSHLHYADKARVGPVNVHNTEHLHYADKVRVGAINVHSTVHLHLALTVPGSYCRTKVELLPSKTKATIYYRKECLT